MMLVQLNVTATDACTRSQAYAFANGRGPCPAERRTTMALTVTRETRLSAELVKLADTLVDEFDVLELLHRLTPEHGGGKLVLARVRR